MKKKTIKKRRIVQDCWNLDYSFIIWLNERLPVYIRDASTIVNLEYHKFIFEDKEYTQKELTEYLLKLCNGFISNELDTWDDSKLYQDIFKIWSIIGPYTWW